MTIYKSLLCALTLCLSLNIVGCDFSGGKNADGQNKAEKEKLVFKVYRSTQDGDWLVAETYEKEIDKGVSPLHIALSTLITEKPHDAKLVNPFTEQTKLLGVTLKGDVAEVNLSKEVLQGVVGSLSELLLVTSIVDTVTEFPEVKKVQILVDGQKVETIAGHMDILDPLTRNESIIKK